jgi:leader peptidase (prepilin peptidase)/N-methyltransferase
VTAVLTAVAALLGAGVGVLADRAAGRFPWSRETPARQLWRENVRPGASAVHPVVLAVGTAALFALAVLRFGAAPEVAAYLVAAGAGVLLAVVDLQHRLLPDRVVLPTIATVAVLLGLAAAVDGTVAPLVRALLGGVVLFVVFFGLALLSPASLGMGDVKLAALLGLVLGWLGWPAVLLGALAGFVLQSVLSLGLLATRRIGLKGHLPFGPAMLAGAAVVVALPGLLGGGLAAL